MDFEPEAFDWLLGPGRWLAAVAVVAVLALLFGFLVSFLSSGRDGLRFFTGQLKRFFTEVGNLSPARIGAITQLAIKESLRRKALWIFAVFALLFMFAGWFLGSSEYASAQPYVDFVLKVVYFLTLPLSVLLACWGLPADIKARSLHTVVTKPVRRTEVVVGRMFGYGIVTGAVVLVMGLIGYVWINRQVPERAQDQLISRVPVYADDIAFKGRFGEDSVGINVGDVWDYRAFVEGNTKARAIYKFRDLDLEKVASSDRPLRLEYNFEVFRSYKGDVGEDVLKGLASRAIGTQAQLAIINPMDPENPDDDLLVRYPPLPFEVEEFKEGADESIIEIPLVLEGDVVGGEVTTYNLIDDLAFDSDGDGTKDALNVAVRCVDAQQYLGAARLDMFIRLPDRSFLVGYAKAIGGVLLMSFLVIILGTTASTFVKGPVATLLTVGLVALGDGRARGFADEYLDEFADAGKVTGGGMIESLVRLVTQQSLTVPLDDTPANQAIQTVDYGLLRSLTLLFDAIPDLRSFNMAPYVSKGFDVPFEATFLPSVMTVLGFFIPCVIIGYFSLQLRELEAK